MAGFAGGLVIGDKEKKIQNRNKGNFYGFDQSN